MFGVFVACCCWLWRCRRWQWWWQWWWCEIWTDYLQMYASTFVHARHVSRWVRFHYIACILSTVGAQASRFTFAQPLNTHTVRKFRALINLLASAEQSIYRTSIPYLLPESDGCKCFSTVIVAIEVAPEAQARVRWREREYDGKCFCRSYFWHSVRMWKAAKIHHHFCLLWLEFYALKTSYNMYIYQLVATDDDTQSLALSFGTYHLCVFVRMRLKLIMNIWNWKLCIFHHRVEETRVCARDVIRFEFLFLLAFFLVCTRFHSLAAALCVCDA